MDLQVPSLPSPLNTLCADTDEPTQPMLHASWMLLSSCRVAAGEGAPAHLRQQQVEQGPELAELVLQGRPRQQQPARPREAVQVLRQLALPVLHALRLVDHNVLPLHLRTQTSCKYS